MLHILASLRSRRGLISRFARGRQTLTLSAAARLARVLGLDLVERAG